MAGATTGAMAVAGGINAGLSGGQFLSGMSERKRAKRALENYQRQELNNAFRDVQISTLGSDLMREENARNMATATDTMAQAGDRSIVGGLPKIVAQTNIANQEARNYLDGQAIKRNYAIGQDEQQIRSIKEARDNANISALSSQVNSANQDMWNGLKGFGSALSDGVSLYGQARESDERLKSLKNINKQLEQGNNSGLGLNGSGLNNVLTNDVQTNNVLTNDVQANNVQANNVQTNNVPTNDVQANGMATNFAPFSDFTKSGLGSLFSGVGSIMDFFIPPNFAKPKNEAGYEDYIKKYGRPFSSMF